MEFVEAPAFTRDVAKYLDEDGYAALQWALVLRPQAGDLIPGSGGLRKLRWATTGRGKRGGVRVIYYWHNKAGEVWLLAIYAKNVTETLPLDVLRALRREVPE